MPEVLPLLARLQPQTVILVLDRDQAGREAAQYLLRRINVGKVYSVDLGPHKDPNEALTSGYEMSFIDITHLTPSGARALARQLLNEIPQLSPKR